MVILLFLIALLLVRLVFGLITAAAGGARAGASQLVQQILHARHKSGTESRSNEKTSVSDNKADMHARTPQSCQTSVYRRVD